MTLQEWLEKNDLSQAEFATKVGRTQPRISSWLAQGWVPSDSLPRVAKVTGLSFGELNPEFKHRVA